MKFLFTFLLLMLPALLWAQPGPPVDPDVPISGIEILLFLGGALGLRKYFSSRKKQDH
jgi:hypothetical protein